MALAGRFLPADLVLLAGPVRLVVRDHRQHLARPLVPQAPQARYLLWDRLDRGRLSDRLDQGPRGRLADLYRRGPLWDRRRRGRPAVRGSPEDRPFRADQQARGSPYHLLGPAARVPLWVPAVLAVPVVPG